MFFRKNKLIAELRAEIQRLREALAEAIGARDAFREQAREAIGLAKEKHFGRTDHFRIVGGKAGENYTIEPEGDKLVYLSDYIAPEVKFCPECSVSVRADSWPQTCPACKTLFGDDPEWPDRIE